MDFLHLFDRQFFGERSVGRHLTAADAGQLSDEGVTSAERTCDLAGISRRAAACSVRASAGLMLTTPEAPNAFGGFVERLRQQTTLLLLFSVRLG